MGVASHFCTIGVELSSFSADASEVPNRKEPAMRRSSTPPQRSVAWSRGTPPRTRWLLAATAVAGLAVAGQAFGSVSAAVDDETSSPKLPYIVIADSTYESKLKAIAHGGQLRRDLEMLDAVAV